MLSTSRRGVRSLSILIFVMLLTTLGVSVRVSAQTHVVSTDQLRQQVISATQARQADMQKVSDFLALPRVDKTMQSVHLDPKQVTSAMATMSDEEVARLAARVDRAQTQLAAGNISDRDLLFIIAGIAALILIIVAVR